MPYMKTRTPKATERSNLYTRGSSRRGLYVLRKLQNKSSDESKIEFLVMQGKEWIEREKQRRHPHLDLFGDERRKCEKERMDAERLFHTFRLQPKKQPSAKKMPKQGIKVPPTWRINIHASP